MGFQPHLPQFVGNKSHGAEFLLAQFGMAVQVASPAYCLFTVLVGQLFYSVDDIVHVMFHVFGVNVSTS